LLWLVWLFGVEVASATGRPSAPTATISKRLSSAAAQVPLHRSSTVALTTTVSEVWPTRSTKPVMFSTWPSRTGRWNTTSLHAAITKCPGAKRLAVRKAAWLRSFSALPPNNVP